MFGSMELDDLTRIQSHMFLTEFISTIQMRLSGQKRGPMQLAADTLFVMSLSSS